MKIYLDYRKHDEHTDTPLYNPALRFVRPALQRHQGLSGHEADCGRARQAADHSNAHRDRCAGQHDLLFALDSIPAIYGLTQEPYLVFTANVFALMGLRQLYFLIGGLLKRLVYLSVGLSIILGFIGIKLIFHALHSYHLADWARGMAKFQFGCR